VQPITLDAPLLIIGLSLLVWLRLRKPDYHFQVACQLIGTIWAQYSYIVSWSLARLVPYIAASTFSFRRVNNSYLYAPLVIYVVLAALIASLYWKIPPGIQFVYGEGRIWIQLTIFVSLVLSSLTFAIAMSDQNGPLLMWKALVLIALLHGVAFLYQYIAVYYGLPLIGISRAHGLTSLDDIGDVAVFGLDGFAIYRPGGLAGEPKTVAVIFGITLLAAFLVGRPPVIGRRWIYLSRTALVLSIVGFVGAFSTSAYVGFVIAVTGLMAIGGIGRLKYVKYFFIAIILIFASDYVLITFGLPSLRELLSVRLLERIYENEIDPPVEAAIEILANNDLILLFGAGFGGGTFYIQDRLASSFEYALTPNVGAVAILLEIGLVGTLLLFVPFALTILLARRKMSKLDVDNAWESRFLLVLGITTMSFMLTGSGIPLGFPLAIGSVLGAVNLSARSRN
jgi:hypothetical protein